MAKEPAEQLAVAGKKPVYLADMARHKRFKPSSQDGQYNPYDPSSSPSTFKLESLSPEIPKTSRSPALKITPTRAQSFQRPITPPRPAAAYPATVGAPAPKKGWVDDVKRECFPELSPGRSAAGSTLCTP